MVILPFLGRLYHIKLSVFGGHFRGCTLEAAESVCNAERDLPLEVLDGLAILVDQSLLLR
jgi:hypothetical protein